MSINQRIEQLAVASVITHRVLAIVLVFFIATGASHAEERYGWKLEWNATSTGAHSEQLDCYTLTASGACIDRSAEMSISGENDGSFVLDQNGVVLSGSSQGFGSWEYQTRQNSECYPAEGEIRPTEYTTSDENVIAFWGPEVGERVGIWEFERQSGLNEVQFDATGDGVCHNLGTWKQSGTMADCEPYEDTQVTDEVHDPCQSNWAIAGGAIGTGIATDDQNLVFSATTTLVNEISAGGVFHNVNSVPYTQSLTMTATKIPLPSIHGIELTQAIQVYQKIEGLQRSIADTGGPIVPLVARKPLAVRVALDKPPKTLKAKIAVSWNGTSLGTKGLTQTPACAPPDTSTFSDQPSSRWNQAKCRTADFVVGGRPDDEGQPRVNEGDNRLVVKLYSDDPLIGAELIDEYEFVVNAKATDTVMLGAVNVCATRIGGRWQCLATPVRDLLDGTVLMRKIYPTDDVLVVPTGHQVRLEVVENANTPSPDFNPDGTPDEWDCYDSQDRKVINASKNAQIDKVDIIDFLAGSAVKCEKDMWWYVAVARVNRLYTAADAWLDAAGIRKFYYGLVKPNSLLKWGGMAWAVGEGRGAIGFATGNYGPHEITRMYVRDTVPHEIGHLLGLDDIQSNKASQNKIREQCEAWDATGAVAPPWLYLYSAEGFVIKQEVPFDITTKKAIPPFIRHDVMGYCPSRVWASPYTFKELFDELDSSEDDENAAAQKSLVAASDAVQSMAQAAGVAGNYWLVSGFVDEDSAFLETIFSIEAVGSTDAGTGSHQLEVLDQDGAILFNRWFTPAAAVPTSRIPTGGLPELPTYFVELIPVHSPAAKIVIRDPAGVVLTEEPLGGLEPETSLVYPTGGEQISGEQTLMWTSTDDDSNSSDLVYWVQYSADGSSNWVTLAQDYQDTSLVVDFDYLPGSSGTAVVRILASDGANTGSATSNVFTVGNKLPTVDILSPEVGDVTEVGGLVFLEGYGYDLDDGALSSNSHQWSSDRDGDIGIGHKVTTSGLSEGEHIIRLRVTDSDSNMALADIAVFIGDPPDDDDDGVPDGQDQCPGTPIGESADANGCSASQRDSDGDNVSDADDQCPGTPAEEAVDSSGCSASQIDSDDDGVSDADDLCPNTPPGEPLDANGCSNSQLDTDGDGVNDAVDQCGGTPAGTAVDDRGCTVSGTSGGGGGGGGGGGFGFVGLLALGLAALGSGRSNCRPTK